MLLVCSYLIRSVPINLRVRESTRQSGPKTKSNTSPRIENIKFIIYSCCFEVFRLKFIIGLYECETVEFKHFLYFSTFIFEIIICYMKNGYIMCWGLNQLNFVMFVLFNFLRCKVLSQCTYVRIITYYIQGKQKLILQK